MTANFIAQLVENLYNKIDINELRKEFDGIEKYSSNGSITDEWVNKRIENKDYIKWVKSCSLLEIYLKYKFPDFEETELVRKWAKTICDERISHLNNSRLYFKPN